MHTAAPGTSGHHVSSEELTLTGEVMEKLLAQTSVVSARGGTEMRGSKGAPFVAQSIWDLKTGHQSRA